MWGGGGGREFFEESILLLYDDETGTKETPLHAYYLCKHPAKKRCFKLCQSRGRISRQILNVWA